VTLGVAGIVVTVVGVMIGIHPWRVKLAQISVSPSSLDLNIGDEMPVVLKGVMSDGHAARPATIRRARWTSSDPAVVRIVGGQIRTGHPGRAIVTVRLGGLVEEVMVTVRDAEGRLPRGALVVNPQPSPAPFTAPPSPALLTKGRQYGGPGCAAPTCYFLRVKLQDASGRVHTIACRDQTSTFYVYTTRDRTSEVCFYGVPNGVVSVVVDGSAESNGIAWGSASADGWVETEGSHGAPTFVDFHAAAGPGPRLEPNQAVVVTCKVHDPNIASVNPDGYWYRLASPPWNGGYYAPANTFWNGDVPGQTPYVHNTDWAVRDC
jgi:hypothetical protein